MPLSQPSVFPLNCIVTDRRALVLPHDLARTNEVRVREEALPNLFDGKIERGRVEPFTSAWGHGG